MRFAAGITALAFASTMACGLAACSAGGPNQVPSPSPTSETAEVVSIPMPELPPLPVTEPLTDAEREAKRLELREQRWQSVLVQYPDAVRPDVPFEGYLEGDSLEAMLTCLEAAGVETAPGFTATGEVGGFEIVDPTVETAVAQFACEVARPVPPQPVPSPEAIGWIHDYLTAFLVPCYEANGIENPPPPSREDFVSRWPQQGWYPTSGDLPLDPEFEVALADACPGPDAYVASL